MQSYYKKLILDELRWIILREGSDTQRRSLILAESAQSAESAQFYLLIVDLNYKSKSVKNCKKNFYTFNTLKNLIF